MLRFQYRPEIHGKTRSPPHRFNRIHPIPAEPVPTFVEMTLIQKSISLQQTKSGTRMNSQYLPRRRKRRPMNGVKTVEVVRGTVGYGFTISGQNPCTLNCIVSGSPAEAIGLKPGDFLLAVNGENVSKYPHDEVVRIIGTSVGTLTLQVAENVNSSDSSDDEIPQRQKFHHPNRIRPRRALKECNQKNLEARISNNQFHESSKTSHASSGLKPKPSILNEISNIWDLDKKNHAKQECDDDDHTPNVSAFHHLTQGSQVTIEEQTVKISGSLEHKTYSNSMDNLNTIASFHRGRLTTPINTAMTVDSDESEEEWCPKESPNSVKHFVVGYIGSIEMPGNKNWQYAHLQSFHNAVRRLRTEKKIHTLVNMAISAKEVKLTNGVRKVLAVYPVNRIAFCGLCPDDDHFFGIVTFRASTKEDIGNGNVFPSCSCHVFRVNPEMRPHCMHAQKARIFQFECTRSSNLQRCYEFPKTAAPVVRPISRLYKDHWKYNNNNKVPVAQAFTEPRPTPDRLFSSSGSSSCHSSNSDSGLGFSKDDSHSEGVFVVDMNQSQTNQRYKTNTRMTSSTNSLFHEMHHLSPSVDTIPTPQSAFRQTAKKNPQAKVLPIRGDPKQGRLTLRAMPDPVLDPVMPAPNLGYFPHQKYRSKLNVEHRSRSREPVPKKNATDQRSASSERPLDFRSVSAPFRQLSNEKLTVVESTEPFNSLEDKLSPRATSVTPKFKVRSPSAPPPGYSARKQVEWSPDIRRPLEEIFAIFEKDRQDETEMETRRYSDGQALLVAKQQNNTTTQSRRWKKPGSFRRPKISKLSHSHESLIINENDCFLHNKVNSANSIHSIVNHGDVDIGPGRKVSRVASWAVSFNRLLEDPEGLFVFTEFLRKEFSEENIQFWLAVDNFKRSMDPDKRNLMACEIFEKHLGAKATEPVNVDSLARHTAQQHLHCTSLTMFDAAQKQIFQLMKQDSYSRFLKSDLYKSQLVTEMGSKAMEAAYKKAADFKAAKDLDKKKMTKSKDEEKRRWSLLPWKQKSSKQSEMQKLSKLSKEESRKKVSLATMDLSLMRKEVIQNKDSGLSDDFKFCRVLLPDNSTAVVCARPGQTIRQVLGQLFDKRNLTLESTEVFLLGSDKPLDISEDMSTLGSKEVNVERRVFFQVEISSQQTIGVKAKLNKTIYDVFRPILPKYGYKIDNVILQLNGQSDALDVHLPVSTIHDTHICVITKDENLASGNLAGATISAATSLEEITNKIFEDLMHGKSECSPRLVNNTGQNNQLKKHQPTVYREQAPDDVHHCLDTSVQQRRGSIGTKEQQSRPTQTQVHKFPTNKHRTKTKFSFPNKGSIPSKESNALNSDEKQEFCSERNFHLIIKEEKKSKAKPMTSKSLNDLYEDCEQNDPYETQDNSNINEDNPYVNTRHLSHPSSSPTPIWQKKTEIASKSNKVNSSRIIPRKPARFKFGAEARDIEHFKTFGSSPERNSLNSPKNPKKLKNTNEDQKRSFEGPVFLFNETYFPKDSFLQDSRTPTNAKTIKIPFLNSVAPIASPEDLSSPQTKIRPQQKIHPQNEIHPKIEIRAQTKIHPQNEIRPQQKTHPQNEIHPRLKINPVSHPSLVKSQPPSSLSHTKKSPSIPLQSNKVFNFIQTKTPEMEIQTQKDERPDLSFPQSSQHLNSPKSPRGFLELSGMPQVTFV